MGDFVFVHQSTRRELWKDKDKGVSFVNGMRTLCGLWKKDIRRWIPIILVWGDFEGMEEKKLYEERENNARECVKVMELGVFSYYYYLFSFSFALLSL